MTESTSHLSTSSLPKYREISVAGSLTTTLEIRADGTTILRANEALEPYPETMNERFQHWASTRPDTILAAQRDPDGVWKTITYGQMMVRVRALGQALLDRHLSVERPIVILSDNDLEHLSLGMAANWVGIPYCSVSPAYSLISSDFAKLKHIVATLTPGLVFAANPAFAKAISVAIPLDLEVVVNAELAAALPGRNTTRFAALLESRPTAALTAAQASVNADTISKFMFTSGSTKAPKGVPITQRMWCANQQMIVQVMAFMKTEPPVLVDWLPWNHVFGGNHNVGIVLYNGGTLYIDDGKPTPQGIAGTLRNLREISPTVYFNVPKGFEEIVAAMEKDEVLAQRFFKRVKAFMFAGAGLSQVVWDRLHALAECTVGERIQMLTGLGMTETAPADLFAVGPEVRSGHIGLPNPGVEAKLVPMEGKTEIRFRGPNVMNGYWRNPEQSAEAFDEEGFYRSGDAVKWIDPQDPQKGLLFDGRIAEDFKLATGTFVSVGPLRAKVIGLGAPLVQDAVVTGINRDDVGLLILPRLDECRRLSGLGGQASLAQVLSHPKVVDHFQAVLDQLWQQGTGSSSRVARAVILSEAPSIDHGEVTDKGSINQRAVLQHRALLVEALYLGTAPGLLVPRIISATH
jgi:feruloyl-CoA synthase